jgi:AcrR family transcriptional regulator
MHSGKTTNIPSDPSPKRSFIEEARRSQIILAAIDTLAEIGYSKASLAQIARRAKISTSLIPYHFKDKSELLDQVLADIASGWRADLKDKVAGATTHSSKLRTYIEASLAYMGTRPKHFAAFNEITCSVRNSAGVPLCAADDNEADLLELQDLLEQGQRSGEFCQFDARNMALAIQSSIMQFLMRSHNGAPDLEAYTACEVEIFHKATVKEGYSA